MGNVWPELLGNFGKQRRRPCSVTPSLPTTCARRDATTAGQSTLSAAIPLFGLLIPLLGRQNSAVRQSSGIQLEL
jgi:hypothetical protein